MPWPRGRLRPRFLRAPDRDPDTALAVNLRRDEGKRNLTGGQRALVVRIGALGDVLLTRRLTYSLSRAGFRSTLFAPARHASLLAADSWIEGVLDSESPEFAHAFSEPESIKPIRPFDLGVVISKSDALRTFAADQCERVIQISAEPTRVDRLIARQWMDAAREIAPPFEGELPALPVESAVALIHGATLIHPGSGSETKNWPFERFVELGRALEAQGHDVAWILGPAEASLESARSRFRQFVNPTLPALAATLAKARVFIGNDSGVSHLAGAVGARAVVLFGPTNSAVWAPEGARVRTASSPTRAMKDLEPKAVTAEIGAF